MAVALVAACLLVAGCGGSGPRVPQGSPDARHGADAVDTYASIEFMRALLIASSDGFAGGGSADDARAQLERGRAAYARLSPMVRASDPVLDHEMLVRFDQTTKLMQQGITPDRYRGLVGPLFDQLADGVVQAAVPEPARTDPGVEAEALKRLTMRLAATYDASATPAADSASHLAFQEAWGLWRRASVLGGILGAKLGRQRDRITAALSDIRGPAFPDGPVPVDAPPTAKVDRASAEVVRALDQRFGLAAI